LTKTIERGELPAPLPEPGVSGILRLEPQKTLFFAQDTIWNDCKSGIHPDSMIILRSLREIPFLFLKGSSASSGMIEGNTVLLTISVQENR